MRSASIRLLGHPDHACDLVAEAIVDEYVRRDPASRLRVAVCGGRGVLFIAGDVLSQADFDVSALVKRTLGSLGVTDEMEAFVSLEQVSAERVGMMNLHPESSVTVTGYATSETPFGIPQTVALAKHAAKRIHQKRENDPGWYWLGPDAEVAVIAEKTAPSRVVVTLEHGNEPLEKVRTLVQEELKDLVSDARVEVNTSGPRERRGLGQMVGISGRTNSVYGSLLPSLPAWVGHDAFSVEKAGAWLARAAARKILQSGARASLVQAVYLPGEKIPTMWTARDEQGKDCSSFLSREDFYLDRVMKEWWRPGLNLEAARWGFAGEPDLPWEH